MFKPLLISLTLGAAAIAAQAQHGVGSLDGLRVAVATAEPEAVAAEVRRIDLAQHKLQLRHEHIPNLDMPPMTMVFEVREAADRALLPQLKVGQKLRFVALQRDGVFVAVKLQPQPQP